MDLRSPADMVVTATNPDSESALTLETCPPNSVTHLTLPERKSKERIRPSGSAKKTADIVASTEERDSPSTAYSQHFLSGTYGLSALFRSDPCAIVPPVTHNIAVAIIINLRKPIVT
jgi:hypothetical protein